MLQEMIGKLIVGDRDGTTLWKIAIAEIEYAPITEPAEGVSVATLAENILRCGQLQPVLLCRNLRHGDGSAKYRLIAGRRRLEAMRMLGKTQISAIVIACREEQIPLIALSDNLLRREPDYLEVARGLSMLESGGWTLAKLAPILSETEQSLSELVRLLELSPDERRLLKLCQISRVDAIALSQLSSAKRLKFLQECLADPTLDLRKRMEESAKPMSAKSDRLEKVWGADVRVFLNTVRRAIETMQKAGVDTAFTQSEEADCYRFEICVAKKPGVILSNDRVRDVSREKSLSDASLSDKTPGETSQSESLPNIAPKTKSARGRKKNVSRETQNSREIDRFASMRSIFEAIAEEERSLGQDDSLELNVSRETICAEMPIADDSELSSERTQENREKLEICIDESLKK